MKKILGLLKGTDKFLFLIVVLASVLRFSYLDYCPPAMNWDEVSHGYNAYSILTTGKDEWGVRFPAIFRAYGDYKLPVYIYVTAISEKFFGPTTLAVRLPSVLAGIGTVIFSYLLVLELFKRKNIALISAFLVAIEPWSLFLSRGAFEANLALFLIVSGVYLFLKSFRRARSLILGTVLLGLSVWTYNSARVFVPALVVALVLIYRGDLGRLAKEHKKTVVISLFLFVLFFAPMLIQLLQPVGMARYGKVSIVDRGAIAKIEQARNISTLAPVLNRLVNNRYIYFSGVFAKNWASHFTASFLFIKGGSDYQFSIPGRGILFWPGIIPLMIGFLHLIIKRSKESLLVLAWLLISPIPSALTSEAPHVLRAIVMLPVPMIVTAIGIYTIADWLNGKIHIFGQVMVFLYILVSFFFLENYLMTYFLDYRSDYSWSWQYGYKEVVNYAKANYDNYDKIIVTKKYGEPHEFFMFYWPWSSSKYNSDPNLVRFFQSGWYWVDGFDKFYFVNDWQIPEGVGIFTLESKKEAVNCTPQSVKCLLISSPGKSPYGWKKLKTIGFLNSEPAFEIYTNQK
jgi:4-amino-4-deoxy-L-arabinose transferase-like glycosyltransferase